MDSGKHEFALENLVRRFTEYGTLALAPRNSDDPCGHQDGVCNTLLGRIPDAT
jgi:hypothetical protein